MKTNVTRKNMLLCSSAVLTFVMAASAANAQATSGGTLIDGTTAYPSIDAGTGDGEGIENVITVTGTFDGNTYQNDAFENVDVIASDPKLTVVKEADITEDAEVGDLITYTYTIENTGNVVLTGVTLDDQHTSAAGTSQLDVSSCTVITDTTVGTAPDLLNEDDTEITASTGAGVSDSFPTFGPGDIVVCSATYTVTQADVDELQATPVVAPVTP